MQPRTVPPGVTQSAAAPAPEPSTILVPIRFDLASLGPEIEKRVEATFDGTAVDGGVDIDYRVIRTPIVLSMTDDGLRTSTTVRYSMQACHALFPCVSCGRGEPQREAEITLHTRLQWDPSWRLQSKTTLLPVTYPKPCEVTWFDIDITQRFVAPVLERELGNAAALIDRNMPELTDIRPQAEQIWASLQMPVELAPRTWLVMEPLDIALTPVRGANGIATSTLALRTLTRVVISEKPLVVVPRPLPPLQSMPMPASGAEGLRVPFDLELPYDEVSRLAERDYAGKTVRIGGKPLTIESLRIAPSFDGRIAVEAMIDYRGGGLRNYRGLVFLEGTPRFDPATSSIVIPDLDFTLDPARRGFLRRLAERTSRDSIRARLRESARFPLGEKLAEMRAEVTRGLNRRLGPGAMLRGRAEKITPLSVTATSDAIHLRAVATGTAEVTLE